MMKAQSLEFNIGYAFAKIEKAYILACEQHSKWFTGKINIPLLWWDSPCYQREEFAKRICETFKDIAPNWGIDLLVGTEKQYMVVNYRATKKNPPKKMTVEEIEKALGYKVEIVSE